jgi:CDP-glycerol glycerophosphotransferase (TagB/SpsB family)
MARFLLHASESYALPILRPLATAAALRGHDVSWLATDAVAAQLRQGERRIVNHDELAGFEADATFSTVHRPPPQLPGLQVQLFHGLNLDKRDGDRGHFRIRGLFDLYCTHGPATTSRFAELARQHRDFVVAETGWPKLDPLFATEPSARVEAIRAAAAGRRIVLYASTFTESLSSAAAFLPEARRLGARGDRYWLLTLHPKSDPRLVEAYRALAGPAACFVESAELVDALRATDVLVCDTSSVTEECILLEKPVVTIRTRVPRPFMLDVATPGAVDTAIDTALEGDPRRREAMRDYAQWLHPMRDGHSSERVLDAVCVLLDGHGLPPLRRRSPRWRAFKARREFAALLPEG